MSLIDALVTPIFTPEIGRRMTIARRYLDLTQAQLGERLGASQNAVSDLESGKVAVLRHPFTLSRFREIFGDATYYVLKGTERERIERSPITLGYWERRLARPGNGMFRQDRGKMVARAKPLLGAAQLEARGKKK